MKVYESEQTGLAAGATEPISVSDVKSWSNIETDLDDAMLEFIIVSAREMVESFLSKDIVSKNRIFFIDKPNEEDYMVILPFNAKVSTISVSANNETLTIDEDYEVVGIGGKYIRLFNYQTNIKVTYESDPHLSPTQLQLAYSATKALIEQVYDTSADLDMVENGMILGVNIKKMLNPLRTMFL